MLVGVNELAPRRRAADDQELHKEGAQNAPAVIHEHVLLLPLSHLMYWSHAGHRATGAKICCAMQAAAGTCSLVLVSHARQVVRT